MIVQIYEIQTPEEAAMLDGGYCRSAAGGRRFENQDGPSRWQWQGSRQGAPLRHRRETHHVKAVARSSTAPLFCITPNSCHRHCDPGPQPRRRSFSAFAANCGSKMTGLPLSVGCGNGAHSCCATAGNAASTATRAARAPYCMARQSAFSIASALETSNTPGSSTCSALTTPLSTSIE